MQFFLIDVGATLALLLGYRAYVAYERHRSQLVGLARRTRTSAHARRSAIDTAARMH